MSEFDPALKPKIRYSPAIAKTKAMKFCAYQERSHQEVRNKLFDWGLYSKEVDQIIAELIAENFLNEERFAINFARGKFRIKRWGKAKIVNALKLKGVSEYNIKKALMQFEDPIYKSTLDEVIAKKMKLIKNDNVFKRNAAIARYAIGKGYEPTLVWQLINEIKI
ncbi:MAG: hypothetical protein RIQ89_541 [Bacteroidota bacterium]|jgi:regulatory protein